MLAPPPPSKKNKLTGIVAIHDVVTVTNGPGLAPGAVGDGIPTGVFCVVVLTAYGRPADFPLPV
jgi:hypothetical protein